jgi:hypothetical protein
MSKKYYLLITIFMFVNKKPPSKIDSGFIILTNNFGEIFFIIFFGLKWNAIYIH